ncbi:substrate-binding periplasmic protein [Chitinimonas sp. PSY-7]|uniref:substrate-binding periplasmic protein n=1 Tax=Chitinimonas sp. PSY-7 TaxID=3459088 RepID=UPI00403FECB5
MSLTAFADPPRVINRPTVTLFLGEKCDKDGYVLPMEVARQALIDKIGAEAGIQFNVKVYPWRRAIKMAERGEGLLWGASWTKDRAQRLSYSKQIFNFSIWLVVIAGDEFAYQTIHDLKGKRVGIAQGAQYSGDFAGYRGTLFTVEEEASSLSARLAMLMQNRIDVVMLGSLYESAYSVETLLNKPYGNNRPLSVLPQPLGVKPAHIVASRNHPIQQYLPRIDQAITRLRQRGAL